MRVHVWFGAGRLLIPVKGEESISWLCSEVNRRLTRRLGKPTTVEGLRLTDDGSKCLDGALIIKDVVEEGGAFVAVMEGDPSPAPAAPECPKDAASVPKEAAENNKKMAVCVQCGREFNETEELESERQGIFPSAPAQICRFHAQPPVKFLWTFHYTCCNSGGDRDVPCRGGFHRSQHHTDYPYASFVPYAAKTMSEIECEWYNRERKDLGDGKLKCVRAGLLTERRVFIAITMRQAQLPRVVDASVPAPAPAEESTTAEGSRTVSFRLLKVFELELFLKECAEKPLEWKDKDNGSCWARFSVQRGVVEGAFGLKIEWQCSSEAKSSTETVLVDEGKLSVVAINKDDTEGCGACIAKCSFGGAEAGDAVFADESACNALIVQSDPVETSLASAGNAELRVEQLAPVEATQDPDVLNEVMTQRFCAKVCLTNLTDHETTVQTVSATIGASQQTYNVRSIVVGIPMDSGETTWLEDALPIVIAPHDKCEFMWSAKIGLRGMQPGHDEATRRRAHASLGSRIAVSFNIFTTDPAAEHPQLILDTQYSNSALTLPTRETSAKLVESLSKTEFPDAQLIDWCSCDDIETLWRHFVAVCC